MWVDADAAIVDPTLDIADELGDRDLMGVVAHRYDGQEIPNCGVWVLRRHRRVRAFLDRVWKRTEFVDHDWWRTPRCSPSWDTTSSPRCDCAGPRMFDRTRLLDAGWNSIALDPAPHPGINHYPGRSQEDRIEHLRRDVATARAVVAELAHPSLSPSRRLGVRLAGDRSAGRLRPGEAAAASAAPWHRASNAASDSADGAGNLLRVRQLRRCPPRTCIRRTRRGSGTSHRLDQSVDPQREDVQRVAATSTGTGLDVLAGPHDLAVEGVERSGSVTLATPTMSANPSIGSPARAGAAASDASTHAGRRA